MNYINKSAQAYKTIGEVTKALGLVDKKTGSLQTHTIRYWETQFRQIKPIIRAGRRRYYSPKVFQTIKQIKFLLKEKGLTISGAKKILNKNQSASIDDNINIGINSADLIKTKIIKDKIKIISKKIKDLRKLK